MVVFDTSVLLLLLYPDINGPIDPNTGEETINCAQRIEYLIQQLDNSNEKIIIPTPVLSEILV